MGAEVARLESESGKEGEIRKRFDVAKPGEKIIVIVDKNSEDVKTNGEINNVGFFLPDLAMDRAIILIILIKIKCDRKTAIAPQEYFHFSKGVPFKKNWLLGNGKILFLRN